MNKERPGFLRKKSNPSKNNSRDSSKRRSGWFELGFAGLIALTSLYLVLASPRLIDQVLLEPEEIPPIFFPRLILSVIFVLAVGVVTKAIRGKAEIEVDFSWLGVGRMASMFASMLLYIVLFKPLGFIISTSLLMLFLSWYYGNKNWIKLLALALIFPPLIYFLFIRVFHIFLPRGIL